MKFHLPGGALVNTNMGDITSIKTDAVVNTGNTTLTNKRGLNKIILECAGNSIVNEIKKQINSIPNQRLNFGDVLVTNAGKLGCKNIIHSVSVVFKNRYDSDRSAVQQVVQSCLEKANKKKFCTLAFPAIGTGSSQIKHAECIDAYVSVLRSWNSRYPNEIHFVIVDRKFLEHLQAAFTLHFSSPTTAAPRSRNVQLPGGMEKTPTTSASGGSFPPAATNILQSNHSAMAIESGAMASMSAVTSGPTDNCPICLCDFTDRKTLDKCGHSFCSACIDHSFSVVGPCCPICQTVYGKVKGVQPPGSMSVKKEKKSLPGFPECCLYNVYYEIPSGIQKKGHPNPGKSFHGTRRTAYLPANKEGETVLKMLQRAFEQKLIFTVGDSRTSNKTDVVTWNDIHHKTKIMGGPSRYGYPDSDYLCRVTLELEAKGITPADIFDQKIKWKISN